MAPMIMLLRSNPVRDRLAQSQIRLKVGQLHGELIDLIRGCVQWAVPERHPLAHALCRVELRKHAGELRDRGVQGRLRGLDLRAQGLQVRRRLRSGRVLLRDHGFSVPSIRSREKMFDAHWRRNVPRDSTPLGPTLHL